MYYELAFGVVFGYLRSALHLSRHFAGFWRIPLAPTCSSDWQDALYNVVSSLLGSEIRDVSSYIRRPYAGYSYSVLRRPHFEGPNLAALGMRCTAKPLQVQHSSMVDVSLLVDFAERVFFHGLIELFFAWSV